MIKCQYLRIRTKNYLKYTYCTQLKAPTSTKECSVCELYSHKQTFVKSPKKVLKTNTTKTTPKVIVRKKKKKKKMSDSKRYSIITNDLTKCIECGLPKSDLHEIFFGNNREKSKQLGLVIPLCLTHHNTNLITSIHRDIELDTKYKIIGQKACMEHYNITTEEFIKVFGRNYILEHKKKDTN